MNFGDTGNFRKILENTSDYEKLDMIYKTLYWLKNYWGLCFNNGDEERQYNKVIKLLEQVQNLEDDFRGNKEEN